MNSGENFDVSRGKIRLCYTLHGVPFAALAPDEHYKYLGVRATVTGDFSAEKQYVLDEMRQRLTALEEDRVLSRREREQIIVIAVCSVFRYSAGLVEQRQSSTVYLRCGPKPTRMHGASLKAWMALPFFWISLREGEAARLQPICELGRRWTRWISVSASLEKFLGSLGIMFCSSALLMDVSL